MLSISTSTRNICFYMFGVFEITCGSVYEIPLFGELQVFAIKNFISNLADYSSTGCSD
jgi:hypothetical protein